MRLEDETVWLSQQQIADLFGTFLARNGILHDGTGGQRITNNALAAIT